MRTREDLEEELVGLRNELRKCCDTKRKMNHLLQQWIVVYDLLEKLNPEVTVSVAISINKLFEETKNMIISLQ